MSYDRDLDYAELLNHQLNPAEDHERTDSLQHSASGQSQELVDHLPSKKDGPYAYGNLSAKQQQIGLGAVGIKRANGAQMNIAHMGYNQNLINGEYQAGVGLAGGSTGNKNAVDLDGKLLDAQFGGHANENGFGIGFGATIAEGAVAIGSLKPENVDMRTRLGLGAGLGLGFRLHWSDLDGDGRREIGLGGDFGPISADFMTEAFDQKSKSEKAEKNRKKALKKAEKDQKKSFKKRNKSKKRNFWKFLHK